MKEVALTKGYVASVDDGDYDRVIAAGPWFAAVRKNTVYACRNTRHGSKFALLHNFILERIGVDHESGDGLVNTRQNLRPFDKRMLNAANMRKPHKFKGTTFDKFTGKWKAAIMVDGKHINLGRFDTRKEAADAYDVAALKYFGEFARTNKGN